MYSRHLSRLRGMIVVSAVLFAGGCGGFAIKYKPVTASAPAPVKANVTLKVVDARPAEHGGEVRTLVGNVRGGFGIPQRVNDKNTDVAPRTVSEATVDALGRVGLASTGGQKVLVATINNFWADGFVGYAAKIAVLYELQDASGKQLWSAQVSGGAGGMTVSTGMFQNALTDLAAHATEQFASPPFQQALAM
jgi:hypothetical protein